MKGFRFYACMPSERGSKSASKRFPFDPFTVKRLKEKAAADPTFRQECLALDISDPHWRYNPGAVSPALEGDPASCGFCTVSLEYLRTRCVRIPESLARQIHPELIAYLECEPASC